MGQLRLTSEPMTIGEASGDRLDHGVRVGANLGLAVQAMNDQCA